MTPTSAAVLAMAALIGLCRPALPPATRTAYAKVVLVESASVGIDPLLVVALVDHESHWNEKAISKDGKDWGLGQLRRKFIPKAEWGKLLDGTFNLKKTLWALNWWRTTCKAKTGLDSAEVMLAGYAGVSRPKEGMWCGVKATGESLPLLKSTKWILARRLVLATSP